MYLLDTDVLSNLLRRAPAVSLITRLASVPVDEQCTTSITLGELVYGAHRARDRTVHFLARLEEVLAPNLRILPFDALAARRYGELRALMESSSDPIGDADTRIASIALVHDLTVVTGNVRHFGRVPTLTVENWFE